MDSLVKSGTVTVNTVYIHNAEDVVVEDVCLSFVGFNVGNITYSSVPKTCNADQQFSFKLVDSLTNLVPHYVTQLDLQRSAAKDVFLTRNLKSFSVVNSDIGQLDISQPILRVTMKIEHSVIGSLEKLHLDGRSYLVLYNVTISGMKQKSLHIRDSTVNVWLSNIKTSLDQAVVLGHRASLTLKDTDGKVSLAGSEEVPAVNVQATPQTKEYRPPGVPPQTPQMVQPPPCNKPSILIWAIPMAVATAEAIVIMVNCTKWFPALKGRRVPHGPEEGRDALKQRQEDSSYYYNSTWYYNNEVPMMSASRRQTAGVDKYK